MMSGSPFGNGWAALSAMEKIRSIGEDFAPDRGASSWHTILNSIPDGVFTVDNDKNITFFNRAAARITGVAQEEAIGKKCHQVMRADICQGDCALHKNMESGKEKIHCPVNRKNGKGQTMQLAVSAVVLRDRDGGMVGGVESFRALAEEKRQRGIILNTIGDGVFTVDKDFIITSFNRAAEKMTGVPAEDAVGKKCHQVLRADTCEESCQLRRHMESGAQIVDCWVTIRNASNEAVAVSLSTAILYDEDGNFCEGVETFTPLAGEPQPARQNNPKYMPTAIISRSGSVRKILDILPAIAASEATVLIEGPSGSGKELFAKAIHQLSERRDENFIALNCGALPDTLLESELFGYVQGAFTDAKKDKPGRFALAKGGTILLDEIGDISAALQIKLLRVLQEREYEPLGATFTVKTDARVIAATNRNLHEQVAGGHFRDDLYYRLNVVRISLPSLAERKEDIPLLVDHFIKVFDALKGKHIQQVSSEVMDILMGYNFPGNIRELENIIEYAFVLCRGNEIMAEHIPRDVVRRLAGDAGAAAREPGLNPIARAEAETLRQALLRNEGSKQKTAAEMGIHKTTLWRKMNKYGLQQKGSW